MGDISKTKRLLIAISRPFLRLAFLCPCRWILAGGSWPVDPPAKILAGYIHIFFTRLFTPPARGIFCRLQDPPVFPQAQNKGGPWIRAADIRKIFYLPSDYTNMANLAYFLVFDTYPVPPDGCRKSPKNALSRDPGRIRTASAPIILVYHRDYYTTFYCKSMNYAGW